MAKFAGVIGYAETVETAPGVYEEKIAERHHFGDWIRNTRRLQPTDQLNDDINISNELSIIANPYAMDHLHMMKYVKYLGAAWKITNIELRYPRLILTLGGVNIGEQT